MSEINQRVVDRIHEAIGILEGVPNEDAKAYRIGDAVRVNKPTVREHGVRGEVCGYDPETRWYVVELDIGPQWRGRYESGELTNV